MFKTVLIANRGEIACRIIRTLVRLGVRPVAVHSDVDAEASHVRLARAAGGHSVAIGGGAAADSYLRIDRILDACRKTGAEAVHPGFGFLAENEEFAAALEEAGIVFIGPGRRAIAVMGDKIASKKLAAEAGVSTVPGHPEAVADAAEATAIAESIGFPVMLKASAGGGGKGMRIAHRPEEVAESFRAAVSEAAASFGDGRVFMEKFIEQPRHIEIQVLGDAHGTILHLGERECSIQRRHQKVIEEAPSPFVDDAMRSAMGAQAVALARAVDYRSAGTVEFIVDGARNFYFLEMNTRIQVEHPVTEMVTGVDLVEWMVRIAAGEKLSLRQEDVQFSGSAVEARLYAEDPARGFLPSTGRITRYRPPAPSEGMRIDAGVDDGGEVTTFYDPMIAKVIGHGRDRREAIDRLRHALDGFQISGPRHNIAFLGDVLRHPRFLEGRLSTGFIAEEYGPAFSGGVLDSPLRERLFAVVLMVHRARAMRAWRQGLRRPQFDQWAIRLDRKNALGQVVGDGLVEIEGRRVEVSGGLIAGEPVFDGLVDGARMVVGVRPEGSGYRVTHGGLDVILQVLPPRTAELADLMPVKSAADSSRFLLSPMPGLLVSLSVEAGQVVEPGDTLAVIEAMKMENVLKAETGGVIAALHAQQGDSLAVDQKIVEFE